ncbi:hypothetical protein CVT25_005228 [Psilocybe cyanescens]|uniref:Uncharacterized protein n=1 Tax=Psilocybe cyanescens TaxID=93625 RepID=A0A409XKQ2_PSICY|nr:hypothetical protein CVT25_005228 [Psilocybe cyanescens]
MVVLAVALTVHVIILTLAPLSLPTVHILLTLTCCPCHHPLSAFFLLSPTVLLLPAVLALARYPCPLSASSSLSPAVFALALASCPCLLSLPAVCILILLALTLVTLTLVALTLVALTLVTLTLALTIHVLLAVAICILAVHAVAAFLALIVILIHPRYHGHLSQSLSLCVQQST